MRKVNQGVCRSVEYNTRAFKHADILNSTALGLALSAA